MNWRTQDGDDARRDPRDGGQPFEHHDYLMLMFRNEQDFQQACEVLGIQRVQVDLPRRTCRRSGSGA